MRVDLHLGGVDLGVDRVVPMRTRGYNMVLMLDGADEGEGVE